MKFPHLLIGTVITYASFFPFSSCAQIGNIGTTSNNQNNSTTNRQTRNSTERRNPKRSYNRQESPSVNPNRQENYQDPSLGGSRGTPAQGQGQPQGAGQAR